MWDKIGDLKKGRKYLGDEMPVMVFRMVQYSLRDELAARFSEDEVNAILRGAGERAGHEFAIHMLDLEADLDSFLAQLCASLQQHSMGIMRIEAVEEHTGEITLTIGEDLDCSGIPITGKTVCQYEEGFLTGVFSSYTKKAYEVRELDCWATGSHVCRFKCCTLEG